MKLRYMLLIVTFVSVIQSLEVKAGYATFYVKNAMSGHGAPDIHMKALSQRCIKSVSPRLVTIPPTGDKVKIEMTYKSVPYTFCGTIGSIQSFVITFPDRHGKTYSAYFYFANHPFTSDNIIILKDPEHRLKVFRRGFGYTTLAICDAGAGNKLCTYRS